MSFQSCHTTDYPAWLESIARKFQRPLERSERMQLAVIATANAVGTLLILSPLLVTIGCVLLAVHLATHSNGPLDWFLVQALSAAALFSAWVTFDLARIRPAASNGVWIGPDQAPELYAILDRRVTHFKCRSINRAILDTGAELGVVSTPRWLLPISHKIEMHIGAPLLFFLDSTQLRLGLAGAVAANTQMQSTLRGRLIQSRRDWAHIHQAVREQESISSRLFATPLGYLVDLLSLTGRELDRDCQQMPYHWLLENADEGVAGDLLANQAVTLAYLQQQHWPMVFKAADRTPKPVVRPFIHLELLLDRTLRNENAKRWLLQAQTASIDLPLDVRDLLAGLGIEQLRWSQLPEQNAFQFLFQSAEILRLLDAQWQQQVEPEWTRCHRKYLERKKRFEQLQAKSELEPLRGHAAMRYVKLAGKFLDDGQAIQVYRSIYRNNHDDAGACFACGRKLLAVGCPEEGSRVLQHAADLDASLANRAHALMSEYGQQPPAMKKQSA